MARRLGREEVYAVAERFVEQALKSDGSLFTPGTAIWSAENIEDLYERFVDHPDISSDSFEEKFRRQLDGAPPETRQLAAELLYIYLIFPSNIGGDRKRWLTHGVLDGTSIAVPDDLDAALEHGIANYGPALNYRPWQLTMLLEFFREWKTMSGKEEALADPWRFKEIVFSVPHAKAGVQREALLHLVYPDTFEQIVSQNQKRKIAEHFSYLTDDSTENVDRRIMKIREGLAPKYGDNFEFYDEQVKGLWSPVEDEWDVLDKELSDLVSRFREEREYPAVSDEEDLAAREEFAEDLSPEAVKNLDGDRFIFICQTPKAGATGGVPGLSRYVHNSDEEALEKLRRAVQHLLYAELPLQRRLDDVLTGELRVSNLGEVVATKLLYICYPDRILPVFASQGSKGKATLMRHSALKLKVPEVGSRGERAIRLNDLLRNRLAPYFGDDTHGMKEFLYWLPESGPESEDLRALARELFLDYGYLSRVDRLLKDKRQIIFYGPPGTGKTFVARKLARLYGEGSGGSSLLVQFHPSYAYEDFIEGYRPRPVGGQPGFALVDGPLKKLAAQASENPDARYVLVIDEVNRANLTKVMGELYFLLEYRGDSVTLQYSDDDFSLPKNLWIICTMNTADRSIALVDAALRRRFYFAPFFPDEPPIKGLLHRWLERQDHSLLWVAAVVDEANRRLGDRQVAIGPSYFLREDLSEEWVEIIWEHAVIPYLSEQFFDEEERLEDFALHSLRSAVAGADGRGMDETPDAP